MLLPSPRRVATPLHQNKNGRQNAAQQKQSPRRTKAAQHRQATRFSLTSPGSPPHPKSAPPSARCHVRPVRVDCAALALQPAFGCLRCLRRFAIRPSSTRCAPVHFVRFRGFSVLIRFAHPPGFFQSSALPSAMSAALRFASLGSVVHQLWCLDQRLISV